MRKVDHPTRLLHCHNGGRGFGMNCLHSLRCRKSTTLLDFYPFFLFSQSELMVNFTVGRCSKSTTPSVLFVCFGNHSATAPHVFHGVAYISDSSLKLDAQPEKEENEIYLLKRLIFKEVRRMIVNFCCGVTKVTTQKYASSSAS